MKKFLGRIVFFICVAGTPVLSLAEYQSRPTTVTTAIEEGALTKITGYVTDNFYLVLAFLATMLIIEIIRFGYKKARTKHRIMRYLRLFFDLEDQPIVRNNNIVFAGIGGSGKTSLINAIADPTCLGIDDETKQYVATKYSFTRKNEIFRFTFFDYRGQNSGTLARGIKDHSHDDTKQLNSLIFVVDLIKPDIKDRDEKSERFDSHLKSRVKQHIEEWNESTLNTLFGFFDQDELQYVCLYINTVDRIKDSALHLRGQIKEDFKPLIDRLKRRCGYGNEEDSLGEGFSKFRVIFGSAYNGLNVVTLKSDLIEHSVSAY